MDGSPPGRVWVAGGRRSPPDEPNEGRRRTRPRHGNFRASTSSAGGANGGNATNLRPNSFSGISHSYLHSLAQQQPASLQAGPPQPPLPPSHLQQQQQTPISPAGAAPSRDRPIPPFYMWQATNPQFGASDSQETTHAQAQMSSNARHPGSFPPSGGFGPMPGQPPPRMMGFPPYGMQYPHSNSSHSGPEAMGTCPYPQTSGSLLPPPPSFPPMPPSTSHPAPRPMFPGPFNQQGPPMAPVMASPSEPAQSSFGSITSTPFPQHAQLPPIPGMEAPLNGFPSPSSSVPVHMMHNTASNGAWQW